MGKHSGFGTNETHHRWVAEEMAAMAWSMEDAWIVLNKMPSQAVVTWNAILGGCVRHGHGKEALKHFEQMGKGVLPEHITFVCLLSACSHAGLVHLVDAQLCFNDHRLHDFFKIGTLHLHGGPSSSCWPTTRCREHDQHNAL
jgi:pentatricopeptide repeat protein